MKKCRLCGEDRQDSDLRRTKAKKTLLIMLCGMVWRGRLRVGQAEELYNQSLISQSVVLCTNHFCETASYISDAVAAICDAVTLNLFTMPGHVLGKIATRFQIYQRAIDASIPLTAYDLATFHRMFRNDAVVSSGRSGENVTFFQLDPTRLEDPLRTEPTSIKRVEKQVVIRPTSLSTDGVLELDETNPELLTKQFVIKGRQLLQLFRFCPSCGTKISDTVRCLSLTAIGKTPVVHYICTSCYPFEKRFEGQEKIGSRPSETSIENNMQTAKVGGAEDTPQVITLTGDAAEQDVKYAPPGLALEQLRPEEMSSSPPSKRVKTEASVSGPMDDKCEVGPTPAEHELL